VVAATSGSADGFVVSPKSSSPSSRGATWLSPFSHIALSSKPDPELHLFTIVCSVIARCTSIGSGENDGSWVFGNGNS
jgi:hypothetical protein